MKSAIIKNRGFREDIKGAELESKLFQLAKYATYHSYNQYNKLHMVV